jgi:chromosome segregation ATPase
MGMKIAAVMAMLLLFMTGAFYLYYNDTQKRMTTLIENNAKLETGIKMNEEAIASFKSSIASANAELTRVNTAFTESRAQNRELTDRLAKHEIGMLAAKKPGLVENIINEASVKALRCFEIISGEPLTDKEKGAKDGKDFNSECPWLWVTITP